MWRRSRDLRVLRGRGLSWTYATSQPLSWSNPNLPLIWSRLRLQVWNRNRWLGGNNAKTFHIVDHRMPRYRWVSRCIYWLWWILSWHRLYRIPRSIRNMLGKTSCILRTIPISSPPPHLSLSFHVFFMWFWFAFPAGSSSIRSLSTIFCSWAGPMTFFSIFIPNRPYPGHNFDMSGRIHPWGRGLLRRRLGLGPTFVGRDRVLIDYYDAEVDHLLSLCLPLL